MGKHRGGMSPANRKLKGYVLRLRPETVVAWKEAVARMGLSQRQAAEYLFRKTARELGIDIDPAPHEPQQQPKPLTRLIISPLDC
jgi:hypothetical protein